MRAYTRPKRRRRVNRVRRRHTHNNTHVHTRSHTITHTDAALLVLLLRIPKINTPPTGLMGALPLRPPVIYAACRRNAYITRRFNEVALLLSLGTHSHTDNYTIYIYTIVFLVKTPQSIFYSMRGHISIQFMNIYRAYREDGLLHQYSIILL